MSFVVIEANGPTERLKGALQRRMLEVRAGLFVGNLTMKVREEIWAEIRMNMHTGSAIMIFPSATSELGFAVRTYGADRRSIEDVDGIGLVRYSRHWHSLARHLNDDQ